MNQPFVQLFKQSRVYTCDKSQVLVSADETPKAVFFIHTGYVKGYDISPNGEYQMIAISGPFTIFPLLWAFCTEEEQFYYEAMTTVEYSIMPRPEFLQKVHASPALMQEALDVTLQASRHYQQRVRNLELRTAQERIACRLLFLGARFGHVANDCIALDVPITHLDLAESLNMTRETANRVMRQFEKNGLVRRSGCHITICEPQRLQAVFGR